MSDGKKVSRRPELFDVSQAASYLGLQPAVEERVRLSVWIV